MNPYNKPFLTDILKNVSTQDQATKAKIKYKTVFCLLLKYLAPNIAEIGTDKRTATIRRPVKPYFPLYCMNFLLPGVTTAFLFLLEKKSFLILRMHLIINMNLRVNLQSILVVNMRWV